MRTNESEYRRLEVAIYDLKTENNQLQEALDQVIEDRDSYHDENAELRKDKERLDWLLNDASMAHLCWAANGREQIDQAMEEAQVQRPKVYTTGILR